MNDSPMSSPTSKNPYGLRAIYRYKIPAHIGGKEWQSIGVRDLIYLDEMNAARRAGDDRYIIAYELAKESLSEVNGKPVSTQDGSADTLFNRMPPKVRQLVMVAYGNHHNVEGGDSKAFLATLETATEG